MDDLKKKHCATGTDDENTHETLYNLKRLNEGYGSIVEKMGYTKFKPYLQRLFNSVEMLLTHEISEFKKIDAKYQDIVRQCHIYEKTLAMTKERNSCEMTSLSDSSNTYAFEDLTKVTPYLPPDLLQSTMGIGTSAMQFRLAQRRSSLTGQQFVSTPLGPQRTSKANGAAPVAKFDDDPSFLFTNSLGFQQTEKIFVDVGTDAAENSVRIEQRDVSCQIQPLYVDEQIETDRLSAADGQMQTDSIEIEEIGCQIEPIREEFSTQTTVEEQKHFSCQCFPTLNDQMTETEGIPLENEAIQTDSIVTKDFSSQIHPISIDQQTETTAIFTEDVALQISFDRSIELHEREIQTETVAFVESSTQFEEIEQILLPIVLSEDLPICDEIEISIERNLTIEAKSFSDQQCQTNDDNPSSSIEHATQTDPSLDRYSSSLYIIPSISPPAQCSSTLVIVPQTFSSQIDEEIQCDLTETILSIPIETKNKSKDRRSLIQQQLDEKEKQMNRIIEEYAVLYGEYESERRRNMDLAEARDRLADHIKVLSDELGDREINQEKLLIKSCQQSKLINYMLPQIDCSPTSKKKHHSANSLRRLLPKFK